MNTTEKEVSPREYTAGLDSVQGVFIEAMTMPIEVRQIPGDKISVFFSDTEAHDTIVAGIENGVYTLRHRKTKIGSLLAQILRAGNITVGLPESFHGDLTVIGQNAAVGTNRLTGLGRVEFRTLNAAVRLRLVSCESLTAVTKNSSIRMTRAECPDITLETENGAIIGSVRGNAGDYHIESLTTNAKNNLTDTPDGGRPKRLTVRNVNAPVDIRFVR